LAALSCAILQPSYVPWRGFFHQIRKVDVFVFYDDVQYDKHGWRNRNRIKTANGSVWLTIPVASKGNVADGLLVKDARIVPGQRWAEKHLATIRQSYKRAPFFARYEQLLAEAYSKPAELLADFTIDLAVRLSRELGIEKTRFLRSSELGVEGERTDRLVAILEKLGATHYLSGPSARSYLEEEKLASRGISLEYMKYEYPEYEQLHPPYDPHVSILDLLFMKGPDAGALIWPRL
jgi:hypothetical protein